VGAKDIASRAAGFGMLARKGNGCDFFETYTVMGEIIAHCREGKGPAAVELDTERFYGHFEGDPQRYRGPNELERLRKTRDCLLGFRERALGDKLLDAATLDQIDSEVKVLIDEAVAEARAAPVPTADDALEDVYVTY
jgi:pyruvate dehydrogenase E1 component alpha subunit